jgi:hypothetical protein
MVIRSEFRAKRCRFATFQQVAVAGCQHARLQDCIMTSKTQQTRSSRSRIAGLMTCIVASFLLSSGASAEDWVFRPSFYSHAPNPALEAMAPRPLGRSAYRVPVIGAGPGFAIRGGYRINSMVLQSGQSVDMTIFRQGWFEATP